MPNDPYLSYFGHPRLPAGFNADDNNGDEVDGAGTNWPVWPYLFDSFIPLEVLIITPEMLEVFDGCADYVIPRVATTIPVPAEPMMLALAPPPNELQIATVQSELVIVRHENLIVFPATESTLVIPGQSAKKSIAA